MITCTRCETEQPEVDFPADRSRVSGRYPYCKTCAVELQLQWRVNNPEKHAAIRKRRVDKIKKSHAA